MMHEQNKIPIRTFAVSAVLLSEVEGEIKMLMMHRTKERFWCHVAGKVEAGETGWQAVIREVKEETEIVVKSLYNAETTEQFYVAQKNLLDVIPVFVVVCEPNQKVTINHEHTDYKWCNLDEAITLAAYPGQKILYEYVWRYFVEETPSDHMKIVI